MTNEITQKNLLGASLYQGWRKSLGIIAIHRRNIRMFLIIRVGIGISRRLENPFIDVKRFGMLPADGRLRVGGPTLPVERLDPL